MFSPLEQFDVILYMVGGIPFVHIILPLLLIIVLVKAVQLLTPAVELKLIPIPLQRIVEVLIEFIFNPIKQQVGKNGYIYFPLIFVLFISYSLQIY